MVRNCCGGDLTMTVLSFLSSALACCCWRGGGGGRDNRGDDCSSFNNCRVHLVITYFVIIYELQLHILLMEK